ncbi:hypothetical protein TCAL_13676, partial [Tigriopus californicus]
GDPATNPTLWAYACAWPEVSLQQEPGSRLLILQGTQLVIPRSARAGLLRLLNTSHFGMVKTYQRARQLYYWPNMKNDISQLVQSCTMAIVKCPVCVELLLSHSPEPLIHLNTAFSTDLFEVDGIHFLLLVDRFSDYPLVSSSSNKCWRRKRHHIVLPPASRPSILRGLHASHQGIRCTCVWAPHFYFWPGMNNGIDQVVSSCSACQEHRLSQPVEPLIQSTASRPFEAISVDIFESVRAPS